MSCTTRFFPRMLIVGTLTVAMTSGLAFAQGGGPRDGRSDGNNGPRSSRMIQLLDIDGDGKVSLAEINAEQDRLFAAADVDGDGSLSADEFRRRGRWFQSMGTTTLFDLMDADGGQSISPAEVKSPSERWFARYDANGDGFVSADELPQRRRGYGRR